MVTSGPDAVALGLSILSIIWLVYALILKKDRASQQSPSLRLFYYIVFIGASIVVVWAIIAFIASRLS